MANEKRLIYADDALAAEFTIEEDGAIGYVVDSEVIRRLPTVDAVEVVHGRWIPAGKTEELAKCSVCGTMNHTLDYVFLLNMKYCPYCGAKMDGGD